MTCGLTRDRNCGLLSESVLLFGTHPSAQTLCSTSLSTLLDSWLPIILWDVYKLRWLLLGGQAVNSLPTMGSPCSCLMTSYLCPKEAHGDESWMSTDTFTSTCVALKRKQPGESVCEREPLSGNAAMAWPRLSVWVIMSWQQLEGLTGSRIPRPAVQDIYSRQMKK